MPFDQSAPLCCVVLCSYLIDRVLSSWRRFVLLLRFAKPSLLAIRDESMMVGVPSAFNVWTVNCQFLVSSIRYEYPLCISGTNNYFCPYEYRTVLHHVQYWYLHKLQRRHCLYELVVDRWELTRSGRISWWACHFLFNAQGWFLEGSACY